MLASIIERVLPNINMIAKVAPGHFSLDLPYQEIHHIPTLLKESSDLAGFHWHITNNIVERLFKKVCPDNSNEDRSLLVLENIGNSSVSVSGALEFHSKKDTLFMEHLKIIIWKNYKLCCYNRKLSLYAIGMVAFSIFSSVVLSRDFLPISSKKENAQQFPFHYKDLSTKDISPVVYYQSPANVDKTLLEHTNTLFKLLEPTQNLAALDSTTCTFFTNDLSRNSFDVEYTNSKCMSWLLKQIQYGLRQKNNDDLTDEGFILNGSTENISMQFRDYLMIQFQAMLLVLSFYSLMEILIGRLLLEEKVNGMYFTQRLQGILPGAFWLGNLTFHFGFIIIITTSAVVVFKTFLTKMTVDTNFLALSLAMILVGCFWIGVTYVITTLFKRKMDYYPQAMSYTFLLLAILLNTDREPFIYASPIGLYALSYKSGLFGQTSLLTTWLPIGVLFLYTGFLVGISVLIEEKENRFFHRKQKSNKKIKNAECLEDYPLEKHINKEAILESQATHDGIKITNDNSVEIDSISKVYGTKCALSNVSLSLPLDACTGLLGPNGSGKTTLIKLILGMEKQCSGEITNASESKIGYSPQFPLFWKEFTVQDHLFFAASISGAKNWQVNNEWVLMVARFIGLDNPRILQMKPSMLSGGMQKRLSFGMAIMGRPQLLILDEPTTGVDPVNRSVMWQMIQQYKNNDPLNPVSILLTSHFLEEVDILCQRVAILKEGILQCVNSQVELKKKYGEGYNLTCYIPLQFETTEDGFDASVLEQKQALLEEEILLKLNKGLEELLSIGDCADLFSRRSLTRRRFSITCLPSGIRRISWSLNARFILPFSKVTNDQVNDVIKYMKEMGYSEWSFGMIELSEVFRNVICNSD